MGGKMTNAEAKLRGGMARKDATIKGYSKKIAELEVEVEGYILKTQNLQARVHNLMQKLSAAHNPPAAPAVMEIPRAYTKVKEPVVKLPRGIQQPSMVF